MTTTIDGGHARLPWLVFDDRTVAFPERGQRVFLALPDLEPGWPGPSEDDAASGAWLVRAEAGECVIVPERARITRRQRALVGIGVLHHGDRLEIGDRAARFEEVGRAQLVEGSRLLGRECAYCQVRLEVGPVVRCPLCGTGYHEECWEEVSGKRCCTRDCRFVPGPVEA